MESSGLVDNGTDTVGFDDAPDEECDTSYWRYNRLHREQMTAARRIRISTQSFGCSMEGR